MSGFETKPLYDRFGVEITGLDLADAVQPAHFAVLRALFEEHSALLFRGQSMTPEMHMQLAALFGPIEDRKADERKAGEAFDISQVSNIAKDGTLTGDMDLHTLNLKSNLLWHSDSTFLPVPALTNVLTAHVVTTTGGATELASTRAAFADMPAERQDTLRTMLFRHHFSQSRARISAELAKLPMFNKWPEQQWPAVWKNPVNGAEAIYVASHVRGIVGMEQESAMAFVDALIEGCTQPAYVYSHSWTPGDVLIWDQRAVLHRGTPWPSDQARRLASICASATDADGLAQMRSRKAELLALQG